MSLESTIWPDTTEELLELRLRVMDFAPGENCALVFSPEGEDPGNPDFSAVSIPNVIGGTTPTCLTLGRALYELAVETMVPVSSTKEAEMIKLLENTHRAVNIGLFNEMKIVADALNEHSKLIKGSHILVLGLAYRKNIDDTPESPAAEIMFLLQKHAAVIVDTRGRLRWENVFNA